MTGGQSFPLSVALALELGRVGGGRLEKKRGQTGPHEDFHFITLEEVKKEKQ
jgi:hypothetical protein